MTRLVLGSASPGRRRVLRQAGIEPLVIVSEVDEDAVLARLDGATPQESTTALASTKAEAVAGRLNPDIAEDCVVIGCDSMLYIDGQLRGKPVSAQNAAEQWRQTAGRTGQLHTGHCLLRIRHNKVSFRRAQTSITAVRFGTPTDDELRAYVASGEPLQVAGAFTLDGLGGWFIDGVDGDPSNVIGISLPLVRALLAQAQVSVDQLWAANPLQS